MTSILEDMKLAREHLGIAIAAGAFGALMPFSAYWVSHNCLTRLSMWKDYVMLAVVAAALLFSVRTVWKAGEQTSGERLKATAWVIVLEGLMIACPTPWLAATSLCYLVVINAVSTACVIVRKATPAPQPTVSDVARAQSLTRRDAEKVVRAARRQPSAVPT